ncbi:MAG: carbohydrate kinase, partial [Muribaculaceae bacterium]|nr:carbohydrate kinase [Muribaculaceae bacterium]
MNRFVVGIGEILWDILPEGKKLGGAPANFAYHVKQFGLDSYVVSAVGLDSLGKEIMHNLDSREVNSLLEVTPYPTGTVLVKLSSDGIPQYQITENVAWDHIPYCRLYGSP